MVARTWFSISALSYGAILGETRVRSVVLSMSPCDPRHVGNGVVTGLKMTSPKASSRASPEGFCPVDHTCLTWHWTLKSPHITVVSPGSSAISSRKFVGALPGCWCMYVLTRTSFLCLWSGFSRRIPCSFQESLNHWLRSTVDTVFHRPLWITITSGWPWSHSVQVAFLAHSCFL